MKLNCDLGEGFGRWQMGHDELVMPYIDMANIACGFHASDPSIMASTVQLAIKHNVSIGAHPSYPDLQGFGRREMTFTSEEITHMMLYQLGALESICQAYDTQVDYVKPHGALYHAMMNNLATRMAILQAIAMWCENKKQVVPLMVLANQDFAQLKADADTLSIPLLFEAFADRAYTDECGLVSRDVKGAVLEEDDAIEKQVISLIEHQQVQSINGNVLDIHADTLCVHGDNPQALASVKKIRHLIDSF